MSSFHNVSCVCVVLVSADAVRVVFSSAAGLGPAIQRCGSPHLSDSRVLAYVVASQRTATYSFLLTGQALNSTATEAYLDFLLVMLLHCAFNLILFLYDINV